MCVSRVVAAERVCLLCCCYDLACRSHVVTVEGVSRVLLQQRVCVSRVVAGGSVSLTLLQ